MFFFAKRMGANIKIKINVVVVNVVVVVIMKSVKCKPLIKTNHR